MDAQQSIQDHPALNAGGTPSHFWFVACERCGYYSSTPDGFERAETLLLMHIRRLEEEG